MNRIDRKLLFDRADYELVRAVDETAAVLGRATGWPEYARMLHPRGIRELAEPQAVRMIKAMFALLDTVDVGAEALERRIAALQRLRDEVIEGLDPLLRYNTARALLQVMKELVRERSDPLRRLRLAHDLRSAMLGNPLFIRQLLRRYHLIEMPENWTPVAFDSHVHDANTKGRKSPTHLVMDAWIKGIVRLQVVYYNYVPHEAAEELLRAAAILNIEVRIGVEFRSLWRGRFVEMIWAPRGFSGAADFLKFLDRPRTLEFTRKCRKAAEFRRETVLEMLRDFNHRGRKALNKEYGIELAPVSSEFFLATVRYGQPSIEHIGELLVSLVRQQLTEELARLERAKERNHRMEERIRELRARLGTLSVELLTARYLDRGLWERPPQRPEDLPEINRWNPVELLNELHKVASGFRMTLNLSNLRLPDVVEILYDCRGDVTALEIYNLKDEATGSRPDDAAINEFRHALNSGSVVKLKELIRRAMRQLEEGGDPERADRIGRLRHILCDLPRLINSYRRSPLDASIGSDSASRPSATVHGMGLVVIDTLTGPVRRAIRHGFLPDPRLLPVESEVYRTRSDLPRRENSGLLSRLFCFGSRVRVEWRCTDLARRIDGGTGNLATLGGFHPPVPEAPLERPASGFREYWRYLNSNVRIFLKVLIGFLAAFLTFYWSGSSWWVLAYGGAAIWLGITAVRNVVQLVLAGGGFRSSPLMKWNDFISWQRVADSLFYTGLSVPILEYLVKTLMLNRWLGLNAEENPIWVFSGIALANGFYITGHNLLRAFPRSAVLGNWLRAPLSIPLALLFNIILEGVLVGLGIPGVEAILQQWAAILSKLASDVVGGTIEALADRSRNLQARFSDFRTKLGELFELSARLELLVPEENLVELLRTRHSFLRVVRLRKSKLAPLFYINALDMMYIWMRQPQAVAAMRRIMAALSPEERLIFLKAQELLSRERSISKLFLSGLVGQNFGRALAFYLHCYRAYLEELRQFRSPDEAEEE